MPQSLARILFAALALALRTIPAAHGDPASSWVEWDRASDRVVSAPRDTGAAYPRARQLSNGEILLVYHHGDGPGNCGSRVTVRKSRDGGATWYRTQEVDGPNERGFWGFSNPDFVELGQGRVMLVSAARGRADADGSNGFLAECRRSGLRVRFSDNYGTTWGPPRMIAGGRGRVWEPSVVRLPDGELQIFYAIESPAMMAEGYTQSIEVIRSLDGGQNWSAPILVSQQPGCRNGVPATLASATGTCSARRRSSGWRPRRGSRIRSMGGRAIIISRRIGTSSAARRFWPARRMGARCSCSIRNAARPRPSSGFPARGCSRIFSCSAAMRRGITLVRRPARGRRRTR